MVHRCFQLHIISSIGPAPAHTNGGHRADTQWNLLGDVAATRGAQRRLDAAISLSAEADRDARWGGAVHRRLFRSGFNLQSDSDLSVLQRRPLVGWCTLGLFAGISHFFNIYNFLK